METMVILSYFIITNIIFLFMNKYKTAQKIKINQLYHNYSISTKCFDGTTLYDMFLANQRASNLAGLKNRDSNGNKKSQGDEETINSLSQNKPMLQVTPFRSKNSRVDYQKYSQPTQTIESQKVDQQIYKRGCQSGNNFYTKMYDSLEIKKEGLNTKIRISKSSTKNEKYNSSISRSKAAIASKKKLRYEIKDFIPTQNFQMKPIVEGKIGQYTASAITVISGAKKLYDYQGDTVKQIASLTKIMTCIVSIFLAQKLNISLQKEEVRVSRKAALIPGTTAQLKNGDVLTLQDLLYGMMLPSGNDAAYAIAQHLSKQLYRKQRSQNDKNNEKVEDKYMTKAFQIKRKSSKNLINIVSTPSQFIEEMNKLAQHLKMTKTHFNNPHGLSDQDNVSTANDVAQLCYYAMKNQLFRKIVSTKEYEAKIYSSHQKMTRKMRWANTNKLLDLEHCLGIKTGITPAAGPCMSAYFSDGGFDAVIVILNTKNKTSRFNEVKKLFEWAQRQINK